MNKKFTDSAIIEETQELVLVFDSAGNIMYANRMTKDELGYTGEEILRLNMAEIFRQEFQLENGKYAPFDLEKLKEKMETVMYRKSSVCFSVSLRFFDLEDGNHCLLAEDTAWKKSMERRIRQLKEEEETNQRVRNEFTANVTHELRTPVNGIKGHVITLLDTVKDEEQRRTLEIILYCCDNMSAIINNILDFSKMEAGKFTLDEAEFDFYKMMDQVIATHMAEINKKELRFNIYVDENIPQFLIGDALRIGQILNNLLSNAIKFTIVGHVNVDVSKTRQIGDEVELFFMVSDSGIGISREEQDKLFQSFKQADASITRRFGGTGLGLSISKQLVEMMNGVIHVDSDKGKGSRFSFNIRLKIDSSAQNNREESEAYRKLAGMTNRDGADSNEDFLEFGSENNVKELRKRMEKLILSIELSSWDKAETLAETVKALIRGAGDDMKRPMLRLEMAVRKENYEKSIEAYENVKSLLNEKLGN